MANIRLPYVAWRDGRPRFVPGPRERMRGFRGEDLKHADGSWYSLDEARIYALERQKEIAAARSEARRSRRVKMPPIPRGRTVDDLWEAFSRSDEYRGNAPKGIKGLSPASQAGYRKFVKPLRAEPLWQAPVGALDPVILKAVHQKLTAEHTLNVANMALAALGAALSWGRLRDWLPRLGGRVVDSPYSRLKLPKAPERVRIASDVELNALIAAADTLELDGRPLAAVGDAILLGFFSGQREKDIVEFVPGGGAHNRIELVQSKTGARVSIPMAPRLVERVAAARERRAAYGFKVEAPNIVVNERTGRAYSSALLSDHFARVRAVAIAGSDELGLAPCKSLADFQFRDLRDTSVTWCARAGSTVPEIASLTGHSLRSIHTILKAYLALDAHLADNAVNKLVAYMEAQGVAV